MITLGRTWFHAMESRIKVHLNLLETFINIDNNINIPWEQTDLKHISGQIIIFHQPRFPWNKGISLTKPPFGVRSREVAIIWPDKIYYQGQQYKHCCESIFVTQLGIQDWHPAVLRWMFSTVAVRSKEANQLCICTLTGWWFQPIWKILVIIGIFPR